MSGSGFGDTLDPSEVLAAYQGWVHHRAHQMVQGTVVQPNGEDHDDLVQHGLVAMWQALDTFDPARGALPAWLTFKAAGAMKDSLRPTLKNPPRVALDAVLAEEFTPQSLVEFPDLLAEVTRAYHRGQVIRAMDSLTPKQREYVRLRFFEGHQQGALTAHFGYDPSGLWNAKHTGAKARLRTVLAHLVAA